MAAATMVAVMSTESKDVHPFFKRGGDNASTPHDDQSPMTATINERTGLEDGDQPNNAGEEARTVKGRRKQKSVQQHGKSKLQRTLTNAAKVIPDSDALTELFSSDPPFNEVRRKRRRTGEYDSMDAAPAHTPGGIAQDQSPDPVIQSSPQVLISRSSPPSGSIRPDAIPAQLPPRTPSPSRPSKKLLRLNANGRFSSPPTKISKDENESVALPHKKCSGSQNTVKPREKKSGFVTLPYGVDEVTRMAVGGRISRILSGEETLPISNPNTRRAPHDEKERTPKKNTLQKASKTHPFFKREKPKEKCSTTKRQLPSLKVTASTPGKLKMQALSDLNDESKDSQPFGSALLKDRFLSKHPGAKESPFPNREQCHVRGLESVEVVPPADGTQDWTLRTRRRKQTKVLISPDESILNAFASQLRPETDRALRPDGFHDPSERLNLPEKLLISDQQIANRVSAQLSAPLLEPDMDELMLSSSRQDTHPAIQRMYDRILDTALVSDDARAESAPWTHRHAPTTASDVLQPGSEVSVLRDWLKSLAVQAVVSNGAQVNSSSSKASEKPKKKRKNKASEMDDFLVDDDEDVRGMSELFDSAPTSPQGRHQNQKSIVQVGDRTMKLSNAVLISGPHGCGKTAAAYAVAKELDFKIFEISSSERRSGKDVLERVGDMTENHLMKHHGTEAADIPDAEKPNSMDEAFEKDLESGRQGKMSAFFRPSGNSAPKVRPKKAVKEKTLKAVQEALRKPRKDQQQSLILLEEVDVLFKEDKEFWPTVFKLIVSSKRPFILTCNDEDLVPVQAMSLHAILRFNPPPVPLATDYMLLLAAAEGHLLKRDAVSSLYAHHGRDLRATITELDYWCQMGVGDPREGLGWIYQRWPPGSDIDYSGHKLRLASAGTYQHGMGLLPDSDATAEDALWWAWDKFDLDPYTALGRVSRTRFALPEDAKLRLKMLQQCLKFKDLLSAADAFTSRGIPDRAPLDSSQPSLPEKMRGHFIEGMPLLQTDEVQDHLDLSRNLLLTNTMLAHKAYDRSLPLQKDAMFAGIPAKNAEAKGQFLTRHAFSCFDVISTPAELSATTMGLQQSAFDGPAQTIALDLAPYVRSIVQYDQSLEEQRDRLDLLTSDGRRTKRSRTTRAARSALEGGQRSSTRKERWFTRQLDLQAVLATGGRDWPRLSDPPPSLDAAVIEGVGTPESSTER